MSPLRSVDISLVHNDKDTSERDYTEHRGAASTSPISEKPAASLECSVLGQPSTLYPLNAISALLECLSLSRPHLAGFATHDVKLEEFRLCQR